MAIEPETVTGYLSIPLFAPIASPKRSSTIRSSVRPSSCYNIDISQVPWALFCFNLRCCNQYIQPQERLTPSDGV